MYIETFIDILSNHPIFIKIKEMNITNYILRKKSTKSVSTIIYRRMSLQICFRTESSKSARRVWRNCLASSLCFMIPRKLYGLNLWSVIRRIVTMATTIVLGLKTTNKTQEVGECNLWNCMYLLTLIREMNVQYSRTRKVNILHTVDLWNKSCMDPAKQRYSILRTK